jgi:hypothetical protein
MKHLRVIAAGPHVRFVIAARTSDAAAAKVMKIYEGLVR